MIWASTFAYAGNPPEKQSNLRTNAATLGASGSILGYWGMSGNEVACLPHETSRCLEVIIKPKPSYQSLPCAKFIQQVYTNDDLIDKIELRVFDNEGNYTISEISAYSLTDACGGKSLDYTPGNWQGVYSGEIKINTCIIE
jgi:hypothetical protein